jgi:hypothetical protein
MTTEVCLVDGVGRPKLIQVVTEPDLPLVIGFAHQGITRGPDCRVQFVRSVEEADPDGRPIYRMRAVYKPEIRYAYLTLQPIAFNPPRTA